MKKAEGGQTEAEERQIDMLVYNLYELTEEEIRIVEPDFQTTEEEYKNFKVEG